MELALAPLALKRGEELAFKSMESLNVEVLHAMILALAP